MDTERPQLTETDGPDGPGVRPEDAFRFASGGWGSLKEVAEALTRQGVAVKAAPMLMRQNKTDGFMCVGCSWAKPAGASAFEFCEAGAKATAWDVTSKRIDATFFERHTVAELEQWDDHLLEDAGRLTEPMRWDGERDRYVPISWDEAFSAIGAELNALEPDQAVFYTSGRASLEASYMYQLLARLHGTNNLPDSSNMCHESTSVALQDAIGIGVGTIRLDDFEACDLMFFFGQNPGVNSPRMLHPLQDARKRGVPIITFNPLREPGLVSFVNPQSPVEMLTPGRTDISTQYHQLLAGGDIAALTGLCKHVFEVDDAARRDQRASVLDEAFIAQHTTGLDDFRRFIDAQSWTDIERESGLTQAALAQAGDAYLAADAVIAHYGMGLTQHRAGVDAVRMLLNLLLLRGNIGKRGAGISPVRGHSNVQGQRTVGVSEKPSLVPLDRLAEQFAFEPPRHTGMNTVEACEGVVAGKVRAVIQLGGNLVRSVPDRGVVEPAWRRLRLTVQITTKLNRSHLVHGEQSFLLPCLSRIEIDKRNGVEQFVSMEDSTGCMHGSRGVAQPASDRLLSEPAIIAGLARATLRRGAVDWQGWSDDYSKVRDAIEHTWPQVFHDFNARLFTPGGFPRPNGARERVWKTSSGRAAFGVPRGLVEDPDAQESGPEVMRLFTLRSDGQFNTTVYRLTDRFRRIEGTRRVVLMHASDIGRLGLVPGQQVSLRTAIDPSALREVTGFKVVPYDIPRGCVAGYFPECNPLLPLAHHALGSKVPAAKSIPVRILPS